MLEAVMIDGNRFNGRVSIVNSKTAFIYFKDSKGNSISLGYKPFLKLTVSGESSISQPSKILDIKNGNLFIGAKIGFATNVTLDVDWEINK